MAKFQIPPFFLPGFDVIAELSKEDASKIGEILSGIPIGSNNQTVVEHLKENEILDEAKIFNLVNVLFSLISLEVTSIDNNKTLIRDLTEAYFEKKQDKERTERLEENITTILSKDHNLKIGQKALNLFSESERVVSDFRILSDIRLIYGDLVEERAKSAIVLHNLRIAFTTGGEEDVMFFSLSNTDLVKLKDIIIRAEEKDKQIREHYYTNNEVEFVNLDR